MASDSSRKCFVCGLTGHMTGDCPGKQVPSPLRASNVGRNESRMSGAHQPVCQEKQCDDPQKHVQNFIDQISVLFRNESRDEQGHHGHMNADPGLAAGAASDDDCMILEIPPPVCQKHVQNFIDKFSSLFRNDKYNSDEDTDEEENTDCVVVGKIQHEEDGDDDCTILQNDYWGDVLKTTINGSKKLSSSSKVKSLFSFQQPSRLELQSLGERLDHEGLVIVAEKGQVACRDYPHSRHLCVKYPFKDTPHRTYCNLCYCYVCDLKAPCKYWEAEKNGHCHASEQEFWTDMRVRNRENAL